MSTLTMTINVSNPDAEDRKAMEAAIDEWNAPILAANPPGTPLPKSTAQERRTSYETILVARNMSAHASRVAEAKEKTWRDVKDLAKANPAKEDAAIAAALAALA